MASEKITCSLLIPKLRKAFSKKLKKTKEAVPVRALFFSFLKAGEFVKPLSSVSVFKSLFFKNG